jgi:NADPH oxidase 1
MGESWFQREFLNGRRLLFNILFYGMHLGVFAYGWSSQVRLGTKIPVKQLL